MHQIESFTFLCQYIMLIQIALSLYKGLFSTMYMMCVSMVWYMELSSDHRVNISKLEYPNFNLA